MQNKVCRICKINKPISEFHCCGVLRDGLDNRCKECKSLIAKEHRKENYEVILRKERERRKTDDCKKQQKLYRENNKDRMKIYKKEYYIKNKSEIDERNKTWNKNNSNVVKKYKKKWAELNRERLKIYKKEYYVKNKEKLDKKNKEWVLKNIERHREIARRYRQKKHDNNVSFRIKESVSSRIYSFLKEKKGGVGTEKLLGYSIDSLVEHLESQFDEKMSWENYGTYFHIDHIIPVVLYDLSKIEELRKCWNFRNLRPLFVNQNLSKGSKLDIELVEKYDIFDLLPTQ